MSARAMFSKPQRSQGANISGNSPFVPMRRTAPVAPSPVDAPLLVRSMDKMFWLYLILTAVWISFALLFSNNYSLKFSSTGWPSWTSSVFAVVTIYTLVILLNAWFTWAASSSTGDVNVKNVLVVLFVVLGVLQTLALWFFFRKSSYTTAFYMMVASIVVAAIQFYVVWMTRNRMAMYMQIPFLSMTIFITYLMWTTHDTTP